MAKTTGLESIADASTKVFMVDPRKLKVRKDWNSRDFNDKENAQYIEELYLSVKELGVKQPLTVTHEKGETYVDDGECRFRAAMLVIERDGIDIKIPVRSEERYANETDRLINQRVRNSGKPFTVFEDAKHFKRLIDLGMKQDEIARKCNISAGRVSQILDYNTVGKVGRELVANGQASASLVMEVTKNEGSAAEKALLEGVKAAKKAGREKIKPGDVEGSVRVNTAKAVKEAFEYATIEEEGDEMVVRFPMEYFEMLRQILKL